MRPVARRPAVRARRGAPPLPPRARLPNRARGVRTGHSVAGRDGHRRARAAGSSPRCRAIRSTPSPTGRIRLLEDTNHDGRPDRSRIFADKLVLPSGVMRWKRGVIVTSVPDVLYLEDADDDGVAERREVLVTGFARTNPQHMVNTPLYGLDNWIYLAHEGAAGAVIYTDRFGDLGRPADDARLSRSAAGRRRPPERALQAGPRRDRDVCRGSRSTATRSTNGAATSARTTATTSGSRCSPRAISRAIPTCRSRRRWTTSPITGSAAQVFSDRRAADVRAPDRSRRVHLGLQPDALHGRRVPRRLRAQHVRRRTRPQSRAPRRADARRREPARAPRIGGPRVPRLDRRVVPPGQLLRRARRRALRYRLLQEADRAPGVDGERVPQEPRRVHARERSRAHLPRRLRQHAAAPHRSTTSRMRATRRSSRRSPARISGGAARRSGCSSIARRERGSPGAGRACGRRRAPRSAACTRCGRSTLSAGSTSR